MKTKNSPDKSHAVADDVETAAVIDEPTAAKVAPKAKTVSTSAPAGEWAIEHSAPHNYADMAKIAAGLLVGVLALMVFLLSVGLQHPKPLLRSFLYASLIALGLNLLFYQLGVMLEARHAAKAHAVKDAVDEAAAKTVAGSARRTLGAVRIVQQLLFALAIVATVGFAIEASQLFFVTAAAQTQAQTQTQAQ